MKAIVRVFRDEFRRVFALRPVFSVLVIGSAFYAVFYPQPYLNEALRNVPIALVDGDGTSASRELARRIDAPSAMAVTMVLPDVASAEREVFARKIFGILAIPKNFERDLLHGRASPIALYADASYFLLYQRIAGGVAAVAQTLGAEIEAARLIGIGVDPALASAGSDPMQLTAVALFNPEGGYATYVLPGAFILILHQILLIAVGLLGTLPGADPAENATDEPAPGPFATVVGKDAGLSAARGGDFAALFDRTAVSLWATPARRCHPDTRLRRAVCPFHQRARPCRCGDFQKSAVGSTCPWQRSDCRFSILQGLPGRPK